MSFHAVRIYNVADIEKCNYAFRGWGKVAQKEFNINDYKLVFRDAVESDAGSIHEFLEDVFCIFNDPDKYEKQKFGYDYKGHSMSNSDVVQLEGKYYYCDDIGWKDITEEVKKDEKV